MSVSAVSGSPTVQAYQPPPSATGTQSAPQAAQSLGQGVRLQKGRHGGHHHGAQQAPSAATTPPTTTTATATTGNAAASGTNFVV
jgi:hypothetical protein